MPELPLSNAGGFVFSGSGSGGSGGGAMGATSQVSSVVNIGVGVGAVVARSHSAHPVHAIRIAISPRTKGLEPEPRRCLIVEQRAQS